MLFGPLAILVIWTAYSFVFLKHDRQGHTTLSGIAASAKRAYWIFLVGLISSGILIFLFCKQWLAVKLQLSGGFLWLVGIATLVFQPIVAIVPMSGGINTKIHDVAANIEGLLLIPIAFFIVQSQQLISPVRVIGWALLLFMIYLGREFQHHYQKPKFIHIQAMFVASFHLIVLIATVAAAINS